MLINNVPFTIVGVTEPEFYGVQPGEKIDLYIPLTMTASVFPGFTDAGGSADVLRAPFRNWLHVMGRLQDGVSREKASANLEPVFAQLMRVAVASLAGLPFDSPAVRKTFLQSRLRLDPGGRGTCRAAPAVFQAALDRNGDCRVATSDHLRQRCQSAAGPGECKGEGDCLTARIGRRQEAPDPAVAYGKYFSGIGRRHDGHGPGVLGKQRVAGAHSTRA